MFKICILSRTAPNSNSAASFADHCTEAMMEKIRTREPLFKLSDVKGAQDQLAAQVAP